ncbi:hypothetical protein [Paenibacillus sp. PCH8]|uniref:hypothetical protein n=1 Tax=Paenibacillus sp. PCH8 TaxID=2066524 RepID=UPI0015E459B0|nr:hypothetical protein [Paenibacillus sp. PCH8]
MQSILLVEDDAKLAGLLAEYRSGNQQTDLEYFGSDADQSAVSVMPLSHYNQYNAI